MATTTTDRRNGVNSSAAVKVPCRVTTTVNITLSGTQTINGVAVVAGDRVLVKNQTDPVENGIYDVATIAWTRSPDWDGNIDVVKGSSVRITEGTTNKGEWFLATDNPIVPGTTSISFTLAQVTNENSIVIYTTDIASDSNTPNEYSSTWYDSNKILGSGTTWIFTGTTTSGNAGLGLHTDSYVYNANGDQYQAEGNNVNMYGALNDNSTDNTAAVHLARDAAYNAGGGTIEFGTGVYKGNFIARKWVHWLGQSNKGTVLKAFDATSSTVRNPLTADGLDSPPHLNRWSFKKFLIDGDHSSDTINNLAVAFDISPENDSWVDQFQIEEVHFDDCYKGMRLHGIETGAASNPSFIQKGTLQNVRFAAPNSTQSTQFHIKGVVIESEFNIFINYEGTSDPAYIIEASAGSPINTPSRLLFYNLVVDKGSATNNCGQITAGRNLTFIGGYHESSNNSISMTTTDELVNITFINHRFNAYLAHAVIGDKIDGLNFHSCEFLSGTTSNANEAVDFSGGALADVKNVTFTGSVRHDEHAGQLVNLPAGLPSLANEATPALDTGDKYYFSTNATEITDLDNAIENHIYTLVRTGGANAQWIDNTGNFSTLSKPFYPRTNGDSISLMLVATTWREVGRAQIPDNTTYTTTGANQTVDSSGYASIAFNQGSASSIDDFAGNASESDGLELFIYAVNGNTTINHGSGINTNTGANLTLTANIGYKLFSRGGTWYMLGA